MKIWPFNREARAGAFTGDSNADVHVEPADGKYGEVDAARTASVEAASGILSRALAMATIAPASARTSALDAPTLLLAGRELVRRGECVFRVVVEGGSTKAIPVSYWDVQGRGTDPGGWWYRCDMPSPDGTETRLFRGREILHFRWAVSPIEPWRGIGPLQASPSTARLAGKVEGGLGDEANLPSGAVIPAIGTSEQFSEIRSAFNRINLRGRIEPAPLQGNRASFMREGTPAQSHQFHVDRVGPNPPAPLVELRKDIMVSIFTATGIPRELAAQAEGTASREAWRRFLHGTIQPLGDCLAAEASMKLGVEVSFSFDRLFASDLAGRARAFQSLVGGGMDLAKAANLSGLMEASE